MASLLVPRSLRRHIAAVYAFARAADDFADEGTRPAAERAALLDGWARRLRMAVSNPGDVDPPGPGEPANTREIFTALAATIRDCDLPVRHFHDLLSAFRQDVGTTRYATWDALLDYCRRSANPVGRLVLRIAGYRSDRLDARSDALCTALQLTNFWQDLAIDAARNRIYLPLEELDAHGAREEDVLGGRLTDGLRGALRAAVTRTRAHFREGRGVCDGVRGRLRYELRATWIGGLRILERLESTGFDPIGRRPRLRPSDLPLVAWRVVRWRR